MLRLSGRKQTQRLVGFGCVTHNCCIPPAGGSGITADDHGTSAAPVISFIQRAPIRDHTGAVEYENGTTIEAASICKEGCGRIPRDIGGIAHENRTCKTPCSIVGKSGFPEQERTRAGLEC